MLQVAGYEHFGGKHPITAALRNMLAHSGLKAPHTGEPLSEAMVLGLTGGLGSGYSFCPSSINEYRSGVSIVGRYLSHASGAEFALEFLKRIEATYTVSETTSENLAHQNLRELLSQGKPVLAWCTREYLPYFRHRARATEPQNYTVVVVGIDEKVKTAQLGDCAPSPLEIRLATLTRARAGIGPHKNRLLVFEPPSGTPRLQDGVLEGIKACIESLENPKVKTLSFQGLEQWAKLVANRRNKRGWLNVYPAGRLYSALRDVFRSIETLGTGGGLFRPMYADFLEEACLLTERKAFLACADEYRRVGELWTSVADAALASRVPQFQVAKNLYRETMEIFEQKGTEGFDKLGQIGEELRFVEQRIIEDFPLSIGDAEAHLGTLRERIIEVVQAERLALKALKNAAA